jgi:type II restriction enzyme
VTVTLPDGKKLELSAGAHNVLEKYIVEVLIRSQVKKPEIVYIGDTKKKMLYVNEKLVKKLGIVLDKHDKLPDVIVWSHASRRFFVIESVTNVGPVEESRKKEIDNVINKKTGKNYDIVYITAFLDRKTFARFAGIIANETYVWIASEPDQLIRYSKKGIDL